MSGLELIDCAELRLRELGVFQEFAHNSKNISRLFAGELLIIWDRPELQASVFEPMPHRIEFRRGQ